MIFRKEKEKKKRKTSKKKRQRIKKEKRVRGPKKGGCIKKPSERGKKGGMRICK
jgi:hypothetical protein